MISWRDHAGVERGGGDLPAYIDGDGAEDYDRPRPEALANAAAMVAHEEERQPCECGAEMRGAAYIDWRCDDCGLWLRWNGVEVVRDRGAILLREAATSPAPLAPWAADLAEVEVAA